MNVTFVAMGSELLGLERMSAFLKERGHEVSLAFDPALFAERVYIENPHLAKVFSTTQETIDEIVSQKPDIVGFSVIADIYQWALYVATEVKKHIDVPVIFGGVMPMSNPEVVLKNDCVDIVCIDDGEHPMAELLESMERGSMRTDIENLCFKENGMIKKNPQRAPIPIETYPMFDKSLFEDVIPINQSYLTIASKGCPYVCSFCSESFKQPIHTGSHNEEGSAYTTNKQTHYEFKSVDDFMEELVLMHKRYNYTLIEFWDNTFTARKDWTLEFCERYKKEVGVPFKILTHPLCMDEDIAQALKNAGCYKVQFGVQTMNEEVRTLIIKRTESNRKVANAFACLDKVELGYSIDHIFGLPGEEDNMKAGLDEALSYYKNTKNLIQINTFWLSIWPKTEMFQIARDRGMIDDAEAERIENALDDNIYFDLGSVQDKEVIKLCENYQIMFKLLPFMPKLLVNFLIKTGLYLHIGWMPRMFTRRLLDVATTLVNHDYKGYQYIRYYLWQMTKVMKSKIRHKLPNFYPARRLAESTTVGLMTNSEDK
jgi:pyruvate-formate lyase-activating enzyme